VTLAWRKARKSAHLLSPKAGKGSGERGEGGMRGSLDAAFRRCFIKTRPKNRFAVAALSNADMSTA
jgi:hypothetical protein